MENIPRRDQGNIRAAVPPPPTMMMMMMMMIKRNRRRTHLLQCSRKEFVANLRHLSKSREVR